MSFGVVFDEKMNVDKKYTNVSLSKFAKDRGYKISPESIGKYRKGTRTPDPAFLPIISEYLNITEQDLFIDANEKRKQITIQEIKKNPNLYIDYILPSIKDDYSEEKIKQLKDMLASK